MENKTRRELFIAALTDSSIVLPEPRTRFEQYLAKINGQDVTLPSEPKTREEMYLACLAGANVTPPVPLDSVRLEKFLYAACGYDITLPVPLTQEEALWEAYISMGVFRITAQPKDVSIDAGQTAKFAVEVDGGTEPYAYQWYYRPSEGVAWVKVAASSGKTATYTLTAQGRHNGYQYYCTVTDADDNEIESNIATLTVE